MTLEMVSLLFHLCKLRLVKKSIDELVFLVICPATTFF